MGHSAEMSSEPRGRLSDLQWKEEDQIQGLGPVPVVRM